MDPLWKELFKEIHLKKPCESKSEKKMKHSFLHLWASCLEMGRNTIPQSNIQLNCVTKIFFYFSTKHRALTRNSKDWLFNSQYSGTCVILYPVTMTKLYGSKVFLLYFLLKKPCVFWNLSLPTDIRHRFPRVSVLLITLN